MAHCSPGYTEVADTLGGIDCAHAPAVVSVHDPFALNNWTLPVVEALMIVGAIVALVHAVRWWRRTGDPTNLGLWFATIVYVLVIEPPLYFPDKFGLQDQVGLIFVHNVFSVQFLYDRLPLYIVALYPGLTYFVYALVQRTGVLARRGPLAALQAAACVAVVFHCFYEIFDHLGPQLRWWAWNPDAPSNTPWVASVPQSSAVLFAGAAPFGITLLTRWLLGGHRSLPAWSVVLRVIAIGALTPLSMIVFSAPYSVFSGAGAQAVVLWLEIGLLGLVAIVAFWRTEPVEGPRDPYPVVAGVVYLVVFAFLWATALPDFFDASGGRTPDGAPTGSLPYVLVCAVGCVAVLALAARRRAEVPAQVVAQPV